MICQHYQLFGKCGFRFSFEQQLGPINCCVFTEGAVLLVLVQFACCLRGCCHCGTGVSCAVVVCPDQSWTQGVYKAWNSSTAQETSSVVDKPAVGVGPMRKKELPLEMRMLMTCTNKRVCDDAF